MDTLWLNTWALHTNICDAVFWFYVFSTAVGSAWFLWLHLVDHSLVEDKDDYEV